jgi:hypothetical protein
MNIGKLAEIGRSIKDRIVGPELTENRMSQIEQGVVKNASIECYSFYANESMVSITREVINLLNEIPNAKNLQFVDSSTKTKKFALLEAQAILQGASQELESFRDFLKEYFIFIVCRESKMFKEFVIGNGKFHKKIFDDPAFIFSRYSNKSISRFFDRAVKLFSGEFGRSGTWGGERWVKIANFGKKLWDRDTDPIITIDQIMALQHFSGSVFSHQGFEEGTFIPYPSVGALLDRKRENGTLIDFLYVANVWKNFFAREEVQQIFRKIQLLRDIIHALRGHINNPAHGLQYNIDINSRVERLDAMLTSSAKS